MHCSEVFNATIKLVQYLDQFYGEHCKYVTISKSLCVASIEISILLAGPSACYRADITLADVTVDMIRNDSS